MLALVSTMRYDDRVSSGEPEITEDIEAEELQAEDIQAEETVYDVGGFIREHRERANLSLRRLADRAGISNPYLSQIERGIRKPSAEILKRLSRALEISAESLYSKAGLIDAGPAPPTVVEAIEADRRLTPRQKQVLLDLYRALAEAGSIAEEQE
jgi:transcriptional regulator with XRE-family HTH domain